MADQTTLQQGTTPQQSSAVQEQKLTPGNYRLSDKGHGFIKGEESFKATAYPDGGKYSIAFGHQLRPNEGHLRHASLTPEQGHVLYMHDVDWVEAALNENIKVPLTQKQVDALGSLAYNIGPDAFAKSNVVQYVNAGNFDGASKSFGSFITSEGRRNETLVDRRGREATIFNGGDYETREAATLWERSRRGAGRFFHRVGHGMGNMAGTIGDFFKGWVTETNPETGESEFSLKKTGINAIGLLALLWAANAFPLLALAAVAFMALAIYNVSQHGGMSSITGGRWPRTYQTGREIQPGMEPELQQAYEQPAPQPMQQAMQTQTTRVINIPTDAMPSITGMEDANIPNRSNVPLGLNTQSRGNSFPSIPH